MSTQSLDPAARSEMLQRAALLKTFIKNQQDQRAQWGHIAAAAGALARLNAIEDKALAKKCSELVFSAVETERMLTVQISQLEQEARALEALIKVGDDHLSWRELRDEQTGGI